MADSTASTQLTNPFPEYVGSYIVMRTVFTISICVLFFCVFSSFLAASSPMPYSQSSVYKEEVVHGSNSPCGKWKCKCDGMKCMCYKKNGEIEHFNNSDYFNEKFYPHDPYRTPSTNVYKSELKTSYRKITLLPPQKDEEDYVKSTYHGQVHRWFMKKNGEMMYRLEMFCNLPELDADVLVKRSKNVSSQKYVVYLSKDGTQKTAIEAGQLARDGDFVYKLKFISKDAELLSEFKYIHVVYHFGDEQHLMLQGNFL